MVLCFGGVFGSTEFDTLREEEVAVYLVPDFWRELHLAIRDMKSSWALQWDERRRMG